MPITSAGPEIEATWEVTKGILLFLATGLLGRIAFKLEDQGKRQVVLEHIVVGVDGKNGHRSRIAALEDEVEVIRERNLVMDAVAKVEEENYQGEERRQSQRRLRDLIREEMQAFNPRSPAT